MDNLAYFILYVGCVLIVVGVATLVVEEWGTGEAREWVKRWMR